jgi:hypothetical protein
MLDRHNRVACAVRKAIEIGNPHARILDAKTVASICPNIESELKLLRPDLMFEYSQKKGTKIENIIYLVEIATPWSYEDMNHSALAVSCRRKVEKYAPVIADIQKKRPGFKCIQATIIVSILEHQAVSNSLIRRKLREWDSQSWRCVQRSAQKPALKPRMLVKFHRSNSTKPVFLRQESGMRMDSLSKPLKDTQMVTKTRQETAWTICSAAVFFQETLPTPERPPEADQVSVEVGLKGIWNMHTISRHIKEEEFNTLVSTEIGHPVATADFAGAPIEDQQFRFYPDVSHGPPFWITLRQGMKRSNLTMIMRISRESTQEEMEGAVTFYWDQPVEFRSFPKVFDSTAIYWMRPHTEDPPDPNEFPFPEPETLDAIPHIETPTYKPFVCTFPRSFSSDDLKGTPAPVLEGKSADTLTKWVVMFGLRCVTYWAPEDAPVEIVVAKAAASIGLKTTGWRMRRGDKWNIYCSDPSNVPEASIHFGNIEWRGKV